MMKALAHPVRLDIIQTLSETGDANCVDFTRHASLAQSTVSAYMADLERAGLVKATRVGKWTHYKRDEQRIAALIARLGQTL